MNIRTTSMVLWLMAVMCFVSTESKAMKKNEKMEYSEHFIAEWKEVEALELEGKTKSALADVTSILSAAKREGNNPQLIKALLHQYKYWMILEEESEVKVVNDLKAQIEEQFGNGKYILQSVLAELYWQYYQDNRYQFLERTTVAEKADDDFRFWDLNTLLDEVTTLYLESIQDVESLSAESINEFGDIILKDNEKVELRPTLYDLLSHRVIDFFLQNETGLIDWREPFDLNDKKYFAPSTNFVQIDLPKVDVPYPSQGVLQTLQSLIRFRLQDDNAVALADIELKRLNYVYQKATYEEKGVHYLEALTELREKYANNPIEAEVIFFIAQYHYQLKGRKSSDLKAALQLCETAIKDYDKSYGASRCEQLKQQILNRKLTVQMENAVVPGKDFKALINYHNTATIYHKVIALTYEEWQAVNSAPHDKQINQLNRKDVIREWSQVMPASDDLMPHSVELIIESLDIGHYVLLSSTSEKFNKDGEAVVVNPFWSTHLTFNFFGENLKNPEVVVLDRFTGMALSEVKVDVFQYVYDRSARKNNKVIIDSGLSDENGIFSIDVPVKMDRNSMLVEVSKGEDQFITGQQYYHNNWYNQNQTMVTRTFFFTDRSIYRPGQTVNFKAIVLKTNLGKSELIKGYSQEVILKDANYQEVERLTLETNEFGSCSGSFILPEGGLLGQFQLNSNTGSQTFRVEEYKRPKFEVKLDTVSKAYNINDLVKVSGSAKSYSGVNLNDAKISYRVIREVQYPFYRFSYWRPYPQGSSQEIVSGNTIGRSDGTFEFEFEAIPDKSVDPSSKPYFNYKVIVDVTDISGETHSSTTYIKVGYVAIELKTDIPEKVESSKDQTFKIETLNLNGKPEASDVTIEITSLKPIPVWRKNRLWQMPDQFLYAKETHDKRLPFELFESEMDPANWEKDEVVFEQNFNTGNKTKIDVASNVFKAGKMYLVVVRTEDKAGNELKIEKSFLANDLVQTDYELPSVFDWQFSSEEVGAGDVLKYTLSSSEKVHVKMQISFKGQPILEEWIDLDGEQKLFTLPIKSEYMGGLECQYTVTYKNRYFNERKFIDVLYPDNQLKINWLSFRDKLLPGEEEEWTMEVLLPNDQKAHAELLATMYDASLDALYPHSFNFSVDRPKYNYFLVRPINHSIHSTNGRLFANNWNPRVGVAHRQYPQLDLFGCYLARYRNMYFDEVMVTAEGASPRSSKIYKKSEARSQEEMIDTDMDGAMAPVPAADAEVFGNAVGGQSVEDDLEKVALRENFSETALFEPHLLTDENGQIKISFKIPESLTKWKIMTLGHDQSLNYKHFSDEFVTQKEIMVESFSPRFMRQGDKIRMAAKVSNLSDERINANVSLNLIDALTNGGITNKLLKDEQIKNVSVDAGQSVSVFWWIDLPDDLSALTYEVKASAGKYTDGERNTLPVLTNRSLVTETMPLPIRPGQQKEFVFEHLAESGESSSLVHHSITLEMTANPVWYVVQALPYLMEYPYECAEQIFSRFYGNALGSHIVNELPVIKSVFAQWENSEALISALEKNQELKSILLEESPWVRDAINETEQKKRIALLFDINTMAKNQGETLEKLLKMQLPNGGFSWFPGMKDNWYITQYILEGFGHLYKLNVIKENQYPQLEKMLAHAVRYIDDRANEAFSEIKKRDNKYRKNDHLSNILIHYMYTRTFYDEKIKSNQISGLMDYLLEQGDKFWMDKGMQEKALLALAMNRISESNTPSKIMTYFDENAIVSEELGMYWKALESGGYYWYQAPIETQSLIIEAYAEVKKDLKAVDELKIWLLKQKQVQNWKSTKATVEACYALLLQGSDWLNAKSDLTINMGEVSISTENDAVEPGTGYVKKSWTAEEVTSEMSNVEIINNGEVPAWGAVYWQYFEDIDKVKQAETNLKLTKELFVERPSDRGPVLTAIDEGGVEIGDLVKVRITLQTDRTMEYVHMKDLRASGLEPVNVLSQYKYQDGLGYYEMTKDAATHFFFDWLPKGEYVFEYGLRVAHAGEFSNGFTNIECMYAPEFKSHSNGSSLKVVE